MGSTASTNGHSFGNLVEFIGLVGDVNEHMAQVPVKRRRRQDDRKLKRNRRDLHKQRRRHRQRRAMRNKNFSRPTSRNSNHNDRSSTRNFVSREEFEKIKNKKKKFRMSKDEVLVINPQCLGSSENLDSKGKKEFLKDSADKLKERKKTNEEKVYDLTKEDISKIYDLRTLYTSVSKTSENLDSNAKEFCSENCDDSFVSCRNSFCKIEGTRSLQHGVNGAENSAAQRSFQQRRNTINLSDTSSRHNGLVNGWSWKRKTANYSSLRNDSDNKRSHLSRFSFLLPNTPWSKDGSFKPLPTDRKDESQSNKRVSTRIDSYLDASFLKSNVSFHMQGPPRNGHVVLASASAVPRQWHRKETTADNCSGSNTNKENETNEEIAVNKPSRSFRNSRINSRFYSRILKSSNGALQVVNDTIEEETETSLAEKLPLVDGTDSAHKCARNNKNVKTLSPNSEMCSSGVTPVYLAAQEGHLQVLQELVAAGGRMDHPAADGLTPVHAAAQMGCTEVLKYMVSVDPHLIHIRDADGATPLHFSASRGHIASANYLLNNGANPDHADLWGKTSVHDALENRHQEMVRLLMQYSDLPNSPSEDDGKGRHSAGSNTSSSSSNSKQSSGRTSNTNTHRRQSSRQPNLAAQSPFYLHPPDDANNPKTSPPSPCSHHAPTDNPDLSSHYTEIEVNRENLVGSSYAHSQNSHSSSSTESVNNSNNCNSGSSIRSNSRNSNRSSNSHSDSINSNGNMSSSSNMLQELRDTAIQQQLQQEGSVEEPEPFYLHDSDASSSNGSPLQKLFSRRDSNREEGKGVNFSCKENDGGSTERVLRHLQSLDDLVTGVPPPDYETDDTAVTTTSTVSASPGSTPQHKHSPLARIRSEPPPQPLSAPNTSSSPKAKHELLSSHLSLPPHVASPTSSTASAFGGFVPPPPPLPPAPVPANEKNTFTDAADDATSSSTKNSSTGEASNKDSTDDSSGKTQQRPAALNTGKSDSSGEEPAESSNSTLGNHGGTTAAGRGLASISIEQLQSVQLRKTQPKDVTKTHSVALLLDNEKADQSEVIEELKRSVDVGSPSKLKHHQQLQQQQQKQENLQIQITPEQIISKVPQVDASGLPIPEWKRQMLARRAAERATAEEQLARQQQLEIKRLQQLPPWKRQLLEKKSNKSGATPASLYMPRVVEPRKISVALTASR